MGGIWLKTESADVVAILLPTRCLPACWFFFSADFLFGTTASCCPFDRSWNINNKFLNILCFEKTAACQWRPWLQAYGVSIYPHWFYPYLKCSYSQYGPLRFWFKCSDKWKKRGVEKLASVRRLYRTVAIYVCLLFYLVLVFSLKYFRFLFVKPS